MTLLVPGGRELQASDDGAWLENPHDGSFGQSFSFGTVERSLVAQIDRAPGALLVKLPADLREGRAQVLGTLERLRRCGALAVRLEQSKLGWAIDHWLEVLESGEPTALHRTAVTLLVGKCEVTSCGMHAFSLPDCRVGLAPGEGPEAAQALLTELDVYQLAEDPLLRSGQTFALDADAPKRALERWPDDGYPPEHWCHNPYGVWRLSPPGAKGRPQRKLHPEFMPSLVSLLTTLEQQHGPLTRAQVEAATRGAVCMAVDPRAAQQLERTRGYADLDPELVWDQWSVLRANRG